MNYVYSYTGTRKQLYKTRIGKSVVYVMGNEQT